MSQLGKALWSPFSTFPFPYLCHLRIKEQPPPLAPGQAGTSHCHQEESTKVSSGLCLCRATAMHHCSLYDPTLESPVKAWRETEHAQKLWDTDSKVEFFLNFVFCFFKEKKKKNYTHPCIQSFIQPCVRHNPRWLLGKEVKINSHNMMGGVLIKGVRKGFLKEITSTLKPEKLNN